MLKLTLADKSEYEVLPQFTAVYPSFSANARNRMEIHMRENIMTLEQLDALFSDKKKTDTITLTEIDESVAPNKVKHSLIYSKYNYVTSVGKEIVTIPNFTDASIPPVTETHLVVKLEQLTYTEQQLEALGIKV